MDLREATNRIAAQKELVARIRDEVGKVIVGQEKLTLGHEYTATVPIGGGGVVVAVYGLAHQTEEHTSAAGLAGIKG